MNKILTILLLSIVLVSIHGAEWVFNHAPNTADADIISGRYSYNNPPDGTLYWQSASGVTFNRDKDGNLSVSKSDGGSCSFIVTLRFPHPIASFIFTTPQLSGLDFAQGGCRFEYSLASGDAFQPLLVIDKNTVGYRLGGELSPQKCSEVKIDKAQASTTLQLRVTFEGFVGNLSFAAGGILDYTLAPDRKHEVALRLKPDAAAEGYVYAAGTQIEFYCNSDAVTEVTLHDVGRECMVSGMVLTAWRPLLHGTLPGLAPGVYELRFSKGGSPDLIQRFAVVPPPRQLTWQEKQQSPFGIVGISRTGGFRESRPINGPAIARLIGVHQERTGWGSWVDYNAVQGKITMPSRKEIAEQSLRDGLVYRNNLAWTPDWTIDHERLKKEGYTGWTGHYPPQEKHLADYAAFAAKVAEHFKGLGVAEFEIWNEPNNMPFGSFKGTFDEYVAMCLTAAKAVHSVNPDARMILGSTGDADVGFLARCLKAGLSKHFSILDMHPYRHSNQGPEDGLLGDINRLKRAIQEFGDNQSIVFSEVGWPTTAIDTGSYGKVTELQQACFNTRTMLISIAGGVERVNFHIMEDWGSNQNDPEHNFGFFRVDGTPKAAVPAMAANARHLEKVEFMGRMDTPELAHAWYWKTPWEPGAVLATVWADMQANPKPEQIILPGKAVKVFDMWGAEYRGEQVRIEDKRTVVQPGAAPLYIYLPGNNLPELGPLPKCLRPWLKKRVDAPWADTRVLPDYQQLRYKFTPVHIIKAMAFAGVENSQAVKEIPAVSEPSTFDLCCDDTAIRISCKVNSGSKPVNNHAGWWLWAGDCVRIYIGCGNRDFFTDKDYQMALAPISASGKPSLAIINDDSPAQVPAGTELPADIDVSYTAEGWQISARILWSDMGIKPSKNDTWSFDIACSTGSWNNRTGDCWTNPSHWGILTFAN